MLGQLRLIWQSEFGKEGEKHATYFSFSPKLSLEPDLQEINEKQLKSDNTRQFLKL